MKRIVHEPLIHFLLLGGALFGFHAVLHQGEASSPDQVIVSASRIDQFSSAFSSVWQRPPTQPELKTIVDSYVAEEVLTREAMKLGLDQDDAVIRSRLQQKMDFIAEDVGGTGDPTDAELAQYLEQHREDFKEEERFGFRQVFLSREKRGATLEAESASLLAELRRRGPGADVKSLGDTSFLPSEVEDEPRARVASTFGTAFVETLETAEPGKWTGPLRDDDGCRFVLVTERTAARSPTLEEVRGAVRREWLNDQRRAAHERFLGDLLAQYQVTIDWPKRQPSNRTNSALLNR